MGNEKKRMSNFRFRLILIPVAALLIVIAIVADILCSVFSQSLDWYIGRGDIITGTSGEFEDDAAYYDLPYGNSKEADNAGARDYGQGISEEIADEGFVLLKNDGTLPLEKGTKVSPMGYKYVEPAYGGVGSGEITVSDYFYDLDTVMEEYFDVNSAIVSAMESASPKYMDASGYYSSDEDTGDYDGASTRIPEFDPGIYSADMIGDYDTAFIFLGREGGEGNDLTTTEYYDGSAHQLQLTAYEQEAIAFAEENCESVIVIINSFNAFEMGVLEDDPGVDAILWVGQPGSAGFKSMAKILTGEVNPPGKTVDLYAADNLASPAVQNFGDMSYSVTDSSGDAINYVEYEEGIYVGYRYYETAGDLGVIDYDEAVVYPFGFGLNYDDDSVTQELTDVNYSNETGTVTVTGTVTNASSEYDVKEVVQVYSTPPYAEGGIEKATKNLVAFDKIEVEAGKTEEFSVEFAAEDMASYDYQGLYTDGAGSYVLEKGDYTLTLGQDSHSAWGSADITVADTLVYADTSVSGTAVGARESDAQAISNRFDGSNEYMTSSDVTVMSRTDLEGTFPTSSDGKDIPEDALSDYNAWCSDKTLNYDDEVTERHGTSNPTANADTGYALSEFRGLDHGDEQWEDLLDQIDYSASDLKNLIGKAAYGTGELESISKPSTTDVDGPQGLSKTTTVNAYPSAMIIASTWSEELAREFGRAIGIEMITHTKVGWYAPAVNIHRTPFSGRNYEYYSEDPLLSGKIASFAVSGAAEYGTLPYLKHFAVNDQEQNRNGICTWANEQAMREIYFRPFEICVKEAEVEIRYYERTVDEEGEVSFSTSFSTKTIKATTGVMSAMNCVGATACVENYELLTGVLREDWGFEGTVISDSLDTTVGDIDAAVQAGNDLWLWYMLNSLSDTSSAAMQWALRDAVHNIGYSYANSLIMQGVEPSSTATYETSPWVYWLVCINAVLVIGAGICVAFVIYRTLDEKKNPDRYKRKGGKA